MSQQELELPQGWIETNVGIISKLLRGVSYKKDQAKKNKANNLIPILRANNFNQTFLLDDLVYLPKNLIKSEQMIQKNDIILSMSSGSKRLVGKSILATSDMNYAFGTFCGLIRPSKLIHGKLLGFFLHSAEYRNIISSLSKGSNINNLRREHIELLRFSLPPLNEQKRIVSKIDELFSKIDSTKQSLEDTKLQLEQYKQSLLKSAFEGKLTKKWREENIQNIVSNENRLKEILEKRNELWIKRNELLQKNKRKKYVKPQSPNSKNFPRLPNSWFWGSFDQVSERITVGHVGSMKNEYISSGIPFLRSQNVRTNRFEFVGMKFISKKFHNTLQKSKLEPNDVVVVRSGSVGTSCVIPLNVKDANCSDLVIIKQPHGILSKFGSYYINSIVETQIKLQKVGIALDHFNTNSVAKLPLPIPTIQEQEQIVLQIEQGFSLIQNTTKIVESSLQNLQTMKMSVLKQAFEGKLVPQDPNDEPASVLLERIKSTKESQSTKQRGMKNVK